MGLDKGYPWTASSEGCCAKEVRAAVVNIGLFPIFATAANFIFAATDRSQSRKQAFNAQGAKDFVILNSGYQNCCRMV